MLDEREWLLRMLRIGAKAPSPPPPPKTLSLSNQDVTDLARIAQAEAANIDRLPGVDSRTAYGSVADVVLNRMASGRYPGTVRGVIGQRNQFEPVSRYGGIENLPEPSNEALGTMREYLAQRMGGGSPVVGKADHFLNPHASGQTALNSWAKGWRDWPQIGEGQVQHRFAQLGSVPDYKVEVEHGPFRRGDPVGAPLPRQPMQPPTSQPPPVMQAQIADPTPRVGSFVERTGNRVAANFEQSPMGQLWSLMNAPAPATGPQITQANRPLPGAPMANAASASAANFGANPLGGVLASLGSLAGDAAQQQQTVAEMKRMAEEAARERTAYAIQNWGWGA